MLTVKDEPELLQLTEKLAAIGVLYTEFREPDIGNELTAVAIEPDERAKKLCSNMPLMLKHATEQKVT